MYHLSGIVQLVLEALAKVLRVPLSPHTDTWNKLINDIEAGMKAKQVSSSKGKWKAIEPFYAEVLSDIRAIKNAWRNPTMHFRRTYTEEQAGKLYSRVQK